jgi:hypothetical protein
VRRGCRMRQEIPKPRLSWLRLRAFVPDSEQPGFPSPSRCDTFRLPFTGARV